MPRTGRPRLSPPVTALEHVEAFCCIQVTRVEQTLSHRYGMYDNQRLGARAALGPKNDHMMTRQRHRDTTIERRS